MEELAVKKGPSTGMIIGIVAAVVVVIIIIALLAWLFSSKTRVMLTPASQPIIQPVIVQPQPIVSGSRRQTPTVGGSRRREGASFRQVLGQPRS